MAMPIRIDTLEYAKRLAEAGIPRELADAQAQALSDVLSEAVVSPSELVLLKSDLIARMEIIKQELNHRIDALGVELNHRIDALGNELNHRIDALGNELNHRIDALGGELNHRIDALGAELHHRIDALGSKLRRTMKWMVGVSLVMQATILIKLFLMP